MKVRSGAEASVALNEELRGARWHSASKSEGRPCTNREGLGNLSARTRLRCRNASQGRVSKWPERRKESSREAMKARKTWRRLGSWCDSRGNQATLLGGRTAGHGAQSTPDDEEYQGDKKTAVPEADRRALFHWFLLDPGISGQWGRVGSRTADIPSVAELRQDRYRASDGIAASTVWWRARSLIARSALRRCPDPNCHSMITLPATPRLSPRPGAVVCAFGKS